MAAVVVEVHLSFFFLQFIFAFQMSAYLKMLKKDLEVKGPADEGMYELHKSLLKLIKDYNEIFSGQMYYETVVAPLLPCGRGLLALRQIKTNGFIQLEVIPKILSALSPSFVVCSCGQKIITQVEELHEASYMSRWYEETPRIRKNLLTLMIRTMKPATFNYRQFVTLDYQCLASVLQGIYSFFMFVIKFGMT
ncbi:hypothetical protein O3M35_007706 [Rhynocoris fuscipes]|uniref:Uncharacterized protein n=1 Tax=Rhynocoris fuscipes TaxID=488301 RepID=A0AAW1DCV9_9HEMI